MQRGDYASSAILMLVAAGLGFLIPIAAILLFATADLKARLANDRAVRHEWRHGDVAEWLKAAVC